MIGPGTACDNRACGAHSRADPPRREDVPPAHDAGEFNCLVDPWTEGVLAYEILRAPSPLIALYEAESGDVVYVQARLSWHVLRREESELPYTCFCLVESQ